MNINNTKLNYSLNKRNNGMILIDKNNIVKDIDSIAIKIIGLDYEDIFNKDLEILCPELFINGVVINSNIIVFKNRKNIDIKLLKFTQVKEGTNSILLLEELTPTEENLFLYSKILDLIDEAVQVCDTKGNYIFYNNANMKFESLLIEEVIGKHITEIYYLTEETSQMLSVIKTGKPKLNVQFNYTTFKGSNFSTICSTYPIYINNNIYGAVSIFKEYTVVEELSNKIIKLQNLLYKNNKNSNCNNNIGLAKYTFDDIIGKENNFTQSINHAKKAAITDSPVLIYGATGTGKELFAQSIHNASDRKSGPFIGINCAAIPENLLEGLFFGTSKGAFTGASERPGVFEQARGGTLLLDELNSMEKGLQSKLLRALQEKSIRRVGASVETPIDVRVISTINIDPYLAIEKQIIRNDLFYRLAVVYIKIPSLYQHKSDIILFINNTINKCKIELKKDIKNVSTDVLDLFLSYSWPGNVRELQHAIKSAAILLENNETVIEIKHLPHHLQHEFKENHIDNSLKSQEISNIDLSKKSLPDMLNSYEKHIIIQSLQKNEWNITNTAKDLNIKRQSLQYQIRKHGINMK